MGVIEGFFGGFSLGGFWIWVFTGGLVVPWDTLIWLRVNERMELGAR